MRLTNRSDKSSRGAVFTMRREDMDLGHRITKVKYDIEMLNEFFGTSLGVRLGLD